MDVDQSIQRAVRIRIRLERGEIGAKSQDSGSIQVLAVALVNPFGKQQACAVRQVGAVWTQVSCRCRPLPPGQLRLRQTWTRRKFLPAPNSTRARGAANQGHSCWHRPICWTGEGRCRPWQSSRTRTIREPGGGVAVDSEGGVSGVKTPNVYIQLESQSLDRYPASRHGDTAWHDIGAALGLRVAMASEQVATTRAILPPPLRSLAKSVAPSQILVDCGGQGQCGPNTLAYLLGLVGLFDRAGEDLRVEVVRHLEDTSVLEGRTNLKASKEAVETLTMRELVLDSIEAWPEGMRAGYEPTVKSWMELISRTEAWTDTAFVQACADRFSVCFALTGVNDLGDVFPMFVMGPLNRRKPQAWLEVGCWLNRHFVALVNVASDSEHRCQAGTREPAEEMEEWKQFNWPLRTPADFRRLVSCQHIQPQALVAMEFSGAVRSALEEAGVRAISADTRACDIGGMHYQGDVRDIAHLHTWERVYMFPSCYQQFRGDDCLAFKIADGRAFWGIAMVLWCICLPNCHSLLVEQSDTLVADFFPSGLLPDVSVTEAHTSDFGDDTSKFVRLTHRNLQLEAPPQRAAPPYEQPRGHEKYPSAEERDRARSSWARFPRLSEAVARAPLRRGGDYVPPKIDYLWAVTMFAKAWTAAGYPVPQDFRNADAQPSSANEREYQLIRGSGDGRCVDVIDEDYNFFVPVRDVGGEPTFSPMEVQACSAGIRTTTAAIGVDPSIVIVEDVGQPPLASSPTAPQLAPGPCGHSNFSTLRPLKLTVPSVRNWHGWYYSVLQHTRSLMRTLVAAHSLGWSRLPQLLTASSRWP